MAGPDASRPPHLVDPFVPSARMRTEWPRHCGRLSKRDAEWRKNPSVSTYCGGSPTAREAGDARAGSRRVPTDAVPPPTTAR